MNILDKIVAQKKLEIAYEMALAMICLAKDLIRYHEQSGWAQSQAASLSTNAQIAFRAYEERCSDRPIEQVLNHFQTN